MARSNLANQFITSLKLLNLEDRYARFAANSTDGDAHPMKKKPAARKSAVRSSAAKKATSLTKAKPDGVGSLIAEVRQLIQSARRGVSSVIDTFQVMTNFEIGRRIVEHEQKGAKRAAYGARAAEGTFGSADGRVRKRFFREQLATHATVLPGIQSQNSPDIVW